MASLRKTFGENLRVQRKKQGISQEALSFKAKVGTEYISKVEHGKINVCLDTVEKLSRALRVDAEVLLRTPPKKERD